MLSVIWSSFLEATPLLLRTVRMYFCFFLALFCRIGELGSRFFDYAVMQVMTLPFTRYLVHLAVSLDLPYMIIFAVTLFCVTCLVEMCRNCAEEFTIYESALNANPLSTTTDDLPAHGKILYTENNL